MGWREANLCEQFYLLNRWSVGKTVRWATQDHNILGPGSAEVKIVTDTICYTPELRFPDGKWVRT
jgi:hypothetical protein